MRSLIFTVIGNICLAAFLWFALVFINNTTDWTIWNITGKVFCVSVLLVSLSASTLWVASDV